tara:strand:+ start:1734 stop:2999 length:1266 start_codon:yes stop_codon:yes gene_type:complete
MKMIKTKVVPRGKWFVVQQMDNLGKYKQVSKFETEKEAQDFRDNLVKEPEKALKAVSELTVVEAWTKFANYKYELWNTYDSMSEDQAKLYIRNMEKVVSFFPKHVLLRDLSAKHLKEYFKKIRAANFTYRTCNTHIFQFKGMFEWCINEDLVERKNYNIEFFEINDYPELKPTDGSDKRKETTMITLYEVKKLYNEIKPKDKENYTYDDLVNFIGVCLFMYLGARPAEIRAIPWSNISFNTKRIKIDRTINERNQITVGTKADRLGAEEIGRVLIMPSKLLHLLVRFKARQKDFIQDPKYVLQHANTRLPITDKQLRNFLWRSYANIGLAIIEDNNEHIKVISSKFKGEPFKTFRHFASTALLDNQAEQPVLSDNFIRTQIGHQNINTTRGIYGKHGDLHKNSPKDAKIAQALDHVYEDLN